MALNLPKLISNAVAIADDATKSIQVSVTYRAWISDSDQWGNKEYASPLTLRAIYESKHESKLDTNTGQVVQVQGKLTIIDVPDPNGAAGRVEPIDNRDLIVLPDGTTGPIFKPEGLYNPAAGKPFLIELWIGV